MENGQDNAAPEKSPQQLAQERAITMISQYCDTIIGCMFNGIMNSGQQPGIPGQILIMCTCEALAHTIGQAYMGDELEVRKFRKHCMEAFNTVLKHMPVRNNAPAMPQESASAAVNLPEIKF